MKTFLGLFILSIFSGFSALAANVPTCNEMDQAATAVAKINGANFAAPSYRIPEIPMMTAAGAEFSYQFDVLQSMGDEAANQKVGIIQTKALIKTGESKCKVLSLVFTQQ